MRLFESARQTLKKYADFSGRASREEFWLFFAFVIVANAVAGIVGALLGMRGILSGLVGLLLIVPQIAVAVRRLQVWPRTCRSLPAPAASAAGIRVPGILPQIVALGVLGVVLLAFAHLLTLFMKRGTTVPNRYGAAPTAFSFAS
ncbi:DUF805 domain-containing protein [Sphingomonas daechungensis]|uniref:DUF805 domain-containing protein n=1 Tax=Sphingomonas daechungensis TaxID=1176646 RepID=A0ABX6SYF2_9SPHN|nr:DUF805 domain-containing protein [Sphingomonas daechungensis]QNP42455.1 DUF805 domain-containing protein [Sphingomonas daechungensis]